jgi:hypothetical protein
VRGLGETVEKQMVENHHLLRKGEGLAESIDFPRFYSDLLSALKGEGFLWVVHWFPHLFGFTSVIWGQWGWPEIPQEPIILGSKKSKS